VLNAAIKLPHHGESAENRMIARVPSFRRGGTAPGLLCRCHQLDGATTHCQHNYMRWGSR